jgi:membrane-bound lytic murein transglycosylase A
MPTKIRPAPSASSKSRVMVSLCKGVGALIVGSLVACGSAPVLKAPQSERHSGVTAAPSSAPARSGQGAIVQAKSRWVPVDWSALPGFGEAGLHEAWEAWIRSCERPTAGFAALCSEVRRLSIQDASAQRDWMQQRLQPYRVESLQGDAQGLLTAYFEPAVDGSRTPTAEFKVPLYQVPATLGRRKPWFTRQEMDTLPEAQSALQGRAIAYVADPVDAQVLQIQGSGRVRLVQPDGSARWLRLAYAGTNDQAYRSPGRWLLDQGLVRDASWAGIKAWAQQNPQRQQELMWVNPRVIFFRELPADDLDSAAGPRGAQGVSLTAGRSIAVDPGSIPYGTPVWISSQGPQGNLQKLVLAQDTGHAIAGAVRADYFVGTGLAAGEAAGRLRQALQMWVLWPK